MSGYFAVFGKTPALSAAELFAVFEREKMKVKPVRVAAAGMIFEVSGPRLDLPRRSNLESSFWNQFGGVVKAGTIVGTLSGKTAARDVQAFLCQDIWRRIPKGRMEFGTSVYRLEEIGDWRPRPPELRSGAAGGLEIGKALKKVLVNEGRSVRHVTSREPQLSAVTVRKNKLLGPGVEYCLFVDKKQIAVGVTSWVQDYEEFAFREFARPRADAVSGMVPVKLARMLINLAGVPRTAAILDPFCGSGTIVVEAIALGYKSVIGSDLEESAVRETKENIRWLVEEVEPPAHRRFNLQTFKVLRSPAERIDEMVRGEKIAAIVTEPYLGPPLRGRERPDELERNLAELEKIYTRAFAAFSNILDTGTPVVFILPIYKKGGRTISIKSLDPLLLTGFSLDPLIPERFAHTPGFGLTPRGGVIYSRPDQRVLREILRFRGSASEARPRT